MSQVNILEKTDYLQLFLWGQEKCMTQLNITSCTERLSAKTYRYTFQIDHLDIILNCMIFTYQLDQVLQMTLSLSFSTN